MTKLVGGSGDDSIDVIIAAIKSSELMTPIGR